MEIIYTIGIDEVGYGAWAGPVYAVAVLFRSKIDDCFLEKLKDSKQLTKINREKIFNNLPEQVAYAEGTASHEEIDKTNIKIANHLAMQRACELLINNNKDILTADNFEILIDGNSNPMFSTNIRNIVKGDQLIKEISCASIIAKVKRDEIMNKLHEEYPVYNWNSNVGYGTRKHIEAIMKYGASPYHRMSYKPIKYLTSSENQKK